ncbi:hypothetical protein Tco_0483467 [Tanacetum coccineum]
MSTNDKIYVTPSHTKKVFGNMKKVGKGFSRDVTPLFPTMMVQAQKEMGKGSAMPTDPHHTPVIQPSTSNLKRKEIRAYSSEGCHEKIVLDLEITKTTQAKEIASLKKRVNKLERKRNSKTPGLKKIIQRLVVRAQCCFPLKMKVWVIQEEASKHGCGTRASAKYNYTTPSTIPKAKSITFRNPSESTTRTTLTPIPSNIKDKGKAKMIEPEKPLKMKEQIRLDEELALKLQAEKSEQQDLEQEKLTDEEKARLFVKILEKKKKHFAALRSQEKRNNPSTKAQKKSTMSAYLKHMAGYKQSQLKNKSFAKIQMLFDKAMTREEVAIDAIPLATKPPSIVDWKIVKEGKISLFQIIRANGSSKRYSSMIQMLRDFDREDLDTLMEIGE